MYFEIDQFLATLKGFDREMTCEMITSKQHELMFEVSQPKIFKGRTTVFRTYKDEITFLHNLQNEISSGTIVTSTSLNRLRMDNVLKNINAG